MRNAQCEVVMTARQKHILRLLSDGNQWREDEIKSTFNYLQTMYFKGWVMGGCYETGNSPQTRIWWITAKGREQLEASRVRT